MQRRQFLQSTAACLLAAYKTSWATSSQTIAIAWDDPAGKHFIGLLNLSEQAPQITAQIEVPTRAHGLVAMPGNSVLAVGRRPGQWMLRWWPGTSTKPQWLWADDDFSFNGHALLSTDQTQLYTTESNTDSAAGYLTQRDARSLAVLARWPTHGLDPHDLKWAGAHQIWVANGGVLTQAETGRAKLKSAPIDSSLVLINTQNGQLQNQWRLDDPFLSIRHLAIHVSGAVGAALQAEHPDPVQRQNAPVFSLLTPARKELTAIKIIASRAGYAADIAALEKGWAISCPRSNAALVYSLDGQSVTEHALPSACALVADTEKVLVLGQTQLAHLQEDNVRSAPTGLQIDNHAVRFR